jgi:hypothetical protein
MADAPSASTPAASNPVQAATQQVINTLPADQKSTAPVAAGDDVSEDTGEDLVQTPDQKKKEEAAAAKRAYKLKVGGRDVEVDEAELLKRAQMGYSADQKWQEAAQMRKQMEGFVQLLQRDPEKALEQMGYDVDKMAEERLQKRILEMQKSPEQLEREKLQRELQEMKDRDAAREQEYRTKETQRIQDQYAIELENDISSALDNNSYGFPKTPYVVKRIADTMILAVQQGLDQTNGLSPERRQRLMNVTAKDVLPIVEAEIKQELNDMYSASPDDVFESLVGKDRLNKYRRAKIKKTAKPTSASDVKQTGAKELKKTQDQQSSAQKKLNAKDFFKNLGSK